jgi:Holliday junction resolvase RusA-like endonuclease
MGAIELSLGLPPGRPLSLNEERRLHWAVTRRRVDPWKQWMWAMSIQHKLPARIRERPCWVQFVLPFEQKRRRDPHNFLPTVKACVDGMVLARVWPDDTEAFVTVVDSQLVLGREVRIRIGLREEEEFDGTGSEGDTRGSTPRGSGVPGTPTQ